MSFLFLFCFFLGFLQKTWFQGQLLLEQKKTEQIDVFWVLVSILFYVCLFFVFCLLSVVFTHFVIVFWCCLFFVYFCVFIIFFRIISYWLFIFHNTNIYIYIYIFGVLLYWRSPFLRICFGTLDPLDQSLLGIDVHHSQTAPRVGRHGTWIDRVRPTGFVVGSTWSKGFFRDRPSFFPLKQPLSRSKVAPKNDKRW